MRNTAPATPPSQARHRKKRKPKTPEQPRPRSDDSEEDSDNLHQLNTLENAQDFSTYQHNQSSNLDISIMETDEHTATQQRLFDSSTIQDQSQDQFRFIEQQDEDETLADELIHWENASSDDNTSHSNGNAPQSRKSNSDTRDLDSNNPGQGT
jgi:DNA repair ATPase RecN